MPLNLPVVRDVFSRTIGAQPPGSAGLRLQLAGAKATDVQRWSTGRPVLYAVDPVEAGIGLQQLPEGVSPSQLHSSVAAFVQLIPSGDFMPVKTGRRRRRMNPANHRATKKALRRLDGAVRHAKKLFRAEAQIKKTVKRGRSRRR